MIRETMLAVLSPFMSETREGLNDIKRDLEQHKTQTAAELAVLQSSINNPPLEGISRAVLQKLLPYLNNIEEGISEKIDDSVSSLTGDLEDINEKVCNLSDSQMGSEQRISERILELQLPILIGNLNSISEAVTAVNHSLQERNNKTSYEQSEQLAQLCAKMNAIGTTLAFVSVNLTATESHVEEHSNHVNSKLAALHDKQDAIDSKLDVLNLKQDALDMKVMSVNSEIENNVLSNVTKQLQKTSDFLHESHGYTCGGTGGWRRVVYLDMTDPNTDCPCGWKLTEYSERTCGAISTGGLACDSVIFPVSGGAYTSVCGTIRGYQYNITGGFEAYGYGLVTTIDDAYVSGVSLTHGRPRQHIWTFAAGASEDQTYYYDKVCPCDTSRDIDIPAFVGGDYFCESGANSGYGYGFHSNDPLWDGEGCTSSSTCCSFNNPPYFTKQLPNPTTDDIEVRLCHWGPDDTPIEFIELYVKVDEVNIKKLEQSVLKNVTKEILKTYDSLHEDLQQIKRNITNNVTKELQMTYDNLYKPHEHVCGGTGGWRRVVYLDMTDPNTNCPSGLQLTGYSERTCGVVSTGGLTCDSVIFPVSGGAYTSVCGTIRAYQYNRTDGFRAYDSREVTTIDGAYVSGVSLTHGSPRQHIWTFAAGISEDQAYDYKARCPCDTSRDINIPPFVGGDYFCESGVNSGYTYNFHPYDPLWDGENCTSNSTCCSFNNPPCFTKHLLKATTDDIEVRLCHWGRDDTPIEFMELYVKIDEVNLKTLEQNVLKNVTKELLMTYNNLQEDLKQSEHNVMSKVTKELDMTHPHVMVQEVGHVWCTSTRQTPTLTVPLVGSSLNTLRENIVVELILVDSPVTLLSSLSVEEPTLVCVELSEPTSMAKQMHLRPTMTEK